MPFFLKTLVLGDPEIIHFYISRAFGEPGEDKETYFEWYKEIKVLEDICDLEIDAITSISADLDEIIPIVDGIIYFLNPLKEEESELFKMVLPDIFSLKRDIPTIVIFYDQNGVLPLSVNELLADVWVNYPSLEAFVNLFPHEFHQALQSLCLAMIKGDTPLNIENAWMRFPIFIQMANIYFEEKNYYYAAQAVRKAAQIAEIYNKEEYYIISDQAAYLFSKINLYLEASNILEEIDNQKSKNFKKLYVDAMLREANLFFNKQEYETAAVQYERAGQWASIELLERELVSEAFKLAINSWISACQVDKAFKILDNLPHEESQNILKRISEKIGAAAEFLVEIEKFELAREQLYLAINKYQREALSDELLYLTNKLTDVLIQIFKIQTKTSEIYAAKYTYDEIENMWDSYKVKKTDLDSILKVLINSFLEKNNFEIAAILINKLNSLMVKQDLSKISANLEDKYKDSIKKEIEEYIKKGEEILAGFVKAELEIITQMNKKKIEEANAFVTQKKHLKAGTHLLNHANHLKKIGKEDIRDQILTKSLDLFLEGEIFEEFFITFSSLSKDMKGKYLIRIFQNLLDKLKDIEKLEDYERIEKILEDSSRIYRNQLLYDESKEISLIFIKNIKNEALAILKDEENTLGIKRADELIKKATNILSSYLDKGERAQVNFDKIYKKISELYIELDDLHSAQTYNDRIENKAYNTEIHKKIAKLEAEKSEKRTKKAEESREGEELKESLSIIKNKAREALLDQENEKKERKALKRAYFQEGLNHLKTDEFEKSIDAYKRTISRLNTIKKYNLAGVSLAIVGLLLIKENRFEEIREILEKTKEELSGLGKFFSKTFPVTLIEYIIQVRKFQNEDKLIEAISFIENLPLFEEELKLLSDYLGEDYKEERKREPIEKIILHKEETKTEIRKIIDGIKKEKQEISKRRLMKNQYWKFALEEIEKDKMISASNSYFEVIPKLVNKKLFKGASISLIMGTLVLLNEKKEKLAKETFEQYLKENDQDLKPLPEIKIMEYLFSAIENEDVELKGLIIEALLEKLIIFDTESKILENLLGEKVSEEETKGLLSREEKGELSKIQMGIDQNFSKIQSNMGDVRREKNEFFIKRKAMKRRYYEEILNILKTQKLKEAASKYYDLAITLSKRKDIRTSSLLILLHGLCLLKEEESYTVVKKNIDEFLNSLGINKKLVKDTFSIMLIMFIIDVKIYSLDKYMPKIKGMLEILPLFEEEEQLIDIQ
ncbi:MAG: hypothetical protein KGD65_09875 [Candidatus Lokiarchaeota archaeon]|nr:hypothetical protein [Candidatus Lokiarchaeota archaeon]